MESKIEFAKALEALEDGAQSMVVELKELNLIIMGGPHPFYVCARLMPKEEEEYAKLLSKYKDVFAWNYKEMPGLDP